MSADRAKQSFLAAMSHELRTPLNAIIGFAEIIDQGVLGPLAVPQYGEYIRDILGSAQRLLRIIEDVLEISRAEAGELVLNKREVEVRSLLSESVRSTKEQADSKGIKMLMVAPPHVVIQVDPEKLKRVLGCLLSNAVKFSPEGSLIRMTARLDDHGMVRIKIRDRGIGMDPLAVERAFAPFVQLDDKLSREFDGSGLGLPLARLLTELHGGTVHLESAAGTGTIATVNLPAYAGAADTAASITGSA